MHDRRVISRYYPSMERDSSRDGEFVLYQSNPTKQILLYDMATSSCVLTFLKMKNISTAIKNFINTEFMSESGKMPVVLDKNKLEPMYGFTEVYWHVARKMNYTPSLLELAYMDWVETGFLEAELYMCWCYEPLLESYTRPRYTYDLPWPIGGILFNKKKRQVQKIVMRKFKDADDTLQKFNQFLTLLNKKIGNRPFCLSDSTPSCVDALIYGHTKAILSTNIHPKFADAITRQRRITNLADLIDRDYPS